MINTTENSEIEGISNNEGNDYDIDFVTSSVISRVNLKFLIFYIPILWLSGFVICIIYYTYFWFAVNISPLWWFVQIPLLPAILIGTFFLFILLCVFISKLFLVLINIIHQPKEGVFLAEKGDSDFEFWCLRTEIKKLVLFFMNNCPVPIIDVLGFRWFGLKLDNSSHLNDTWCDLEFVEFGRQVIVGQGVALLGSMIIGKYLIIKKIILDDFVVIGGYATIAPGTIIGKDTVLGSLSVTNFNQVLEDGWIYMGVPPRKIKENRYATSRRDIIVRKEVDDEKKYEIVHEVNIDEDKKDLL